MLLSPDIIIVPPGLEAIAHEILESRVIKSVGNYTLHEFKGRLSWSRNWNGSCGDSFPRWDESPRPIAYMNRHMRKRGYPSMMTEREVYDDFGSCLGC